MKVGDLFNVSRGNCNGHETYQAGTIPLVAAGTGNRGIVGFIQGGSKDRLFKSVPCLTVPAVGQGGAMFFSIQSVSFYATKNVAVLTPNANPWWGANKADMLIAVASFLRKQRWRFYYMRPCGSRLEDIELDIKAIQLIAGQINHAKPKVKTITPADVAALLAKLPYGVAIQDLFEVVSKKNMSGENASENGPVPLVSTTETNNGVHGFVDIHDADFLVPGGGLSVAKNGKPMVSRIQHQAYTKTGDIAPLAPKRKTGYTEKELAILAALIETQAWRYSYGRKANWDRMGPQVIV